MKDNSFFTTPKNLYFPKKEKTLEEKECEAVKTDENLTAKKKEEYEKVNQL